MSTYDDVPLPASDYGEKAYRAGRRLVVTHGLRLDRIVWDADEVLWDWLMDASEILGNVRALMRRDVGHSEYIMPKPGVFELLWGMRHASQERELPARMRIWTDGYPWRLWRIGRDIPGFAELLGPPADLSDGAWETFREHPRIFSRVDFTQVAEELVWPQARKRLLASVRPAARAVIDEQFRRDPYDSNLKIPELAQLVDKPGFDQVEIMVDDRRDNIARFVATGRRGVQVISDTPKVLFGTVPNTVWRRPGDILFGLDNNIGLPLARALASLADDADPQSVEADPLAVPEDYPVRQFMIDVPDERLRDEWIEPMRQLRERAAP